MVLRKGLLSIVLIISCLGVFGQTKSKISGSVVNAVSKEPIGYASVTLADQHTGKAVNGAITDDKGNFLLTGIAPGTYTLKVEFVGFKTYTRDNVVVGSGYIKVGALSLSSSSSNLQEVTVTATKPLVENHIDKMVYNAANDLTSQGGVALDVLKKVPSVSVDIDGNVELEGNSNIRFLINGKPSTIFGSSLTDALQSIPASQIQSIEVISSPGAKYDASGTGGIINIILKESRVQGIHGTINASAGTRLENGSFNLNVRKNDFGLNAFFSGNEQLNSTTNNTTSRQSFNPAKDSLTNLYQDGTTAFKRSGYQTGLSAMWDITKKDKMTASFNYNHFGNNSYGFTNQQQAVDGNGGTAGIVYSNMASTLNSGSRVSENATDWSIDYKKNFKNRDQELDILVTTSTGKNFITTITRNRIIRAHPPSALPDQGAITPGRTRRPIFRWTIPSLSERALPWRPAPRACLNSSAIMWRRTRCWRTRPISPMSINLMDSAIAGRFMPIISRLPSRPSIISWRVRQDCDTSIRIRQLISRGPLFPGMAYCLHPLCSCINLTKPNRSRPLIVTGSSVPTMGI